MSNCVGSGLASRAATEGVSNRATASLAGKQEGVAKLSGRIPASLPSARAASIAW